jgi:hypothetical protein
MDICFYTTTHIGDIYFSSLFVNIICKSNKHMNFYYWTFNGDVFFEKIPNIKRLCETQNEYTSSLLNGNPPEKLLDKENDEIFNILKTNNMIDKNNGTAMVKIIEISGKKILFVSIWCKNSYLMFDDFDITSATHSYNQLIQKLNHEFQLNLEYRVNHPFELIEDWIETEEKENLVHNEFEDYMLVFNYVPRSLSFNMNRLNEFIFKLSENNKVILASYDSIFDNNQNIKFIDKDYGIYTTPSCSNLLKIWDIAEKCKKVVILPTGGSWTFLHKIRKIKQNQIGMFNSNYSIKLNNNIKLLLGVSTDFIHNYNY